MAILISFNPVNIRIFIRNRNGIKTIRTYTSNWRQSNAQMRKEKALMRHGYKRHTILSSPRLLGLLYVVAFNPCRRKYAVEIPLTVAGDESQNRELTDALPRYVLFRGPWPLLERSARNALF